MTDASKIAEIDYKIELVSTNILTPYDRNARTHSREQIDQIKASMMEFGWTNPMLVDFSDRHLIVAGHGRLLAASDLYKSGNIIRTPSGKELPKGFVPAIDCTGWSEKQRQAYVIADNQLALRAGWDLELLKVEVGELNAAGFDLSLLGFLPADLDEMLAKAEAATDKNPDDAPEVAEEVVSKLGDVWLLGPHRVLCGDATSADDWATLMQGELCDVVWTDPPYNVSIGKKNEMLDRADKGNRGKTGSIQNDEMSDADFVVFLEKVFAAYSSIMKAGSAIYVAHPQGVTGRHFWNTLHGAGFKIQTQLIWRKNIHVLGRMDYHAIHEPIIYGWKPGSAHRWYGGRKQVTLQQLGDSPFEKLPDGRYAFTVGDTVLYISGEAVVEEAPTSVIYCEKPMRSAAHPTMKPTALIERMLKHSARNGDLVVDGFGGSGSTLIAADRLGMCARLIELDPHYVDVICRRYHEFTGRLPTHAVTGKPFPIELFADSIEQR